MGAWVPLDPSTNLPAGQSAFASSEFSVDPLNPSMIGLTGVPEAEFIGIGGLPRGYHLVGSTHHRLAPRCVAVGVGAIVTSTDVVRLQQDVLAQANALDRCVVGCISKLQKGDLANWGSMIKRATDFSNEDPSTLFAAAQVDAGQAIQRDLLPWYDLLTQAGCSGVPFKPTPPPSTTDAIAALVKPAAIAAVAIAGAYAIGKIAGVIGTVRQTR
jgi:hypothetical protein